MVPKRYDLNGHFVVHRLQRRSQIRRSIGQESRSGDSIRKFHDLSTYRLRFLGLSTHRTFTGWTLERVRFRTLSIGEVPGMSILISSSISALAGG